METIKSKKEFELVFKGGKRVNHKLVRATILVHTEGGHGRVAFVAPKRLGNAVFRNRCKRVLREATRALDVSFDNADVILFATRKTHDSHPSEVSLALEQVLSRAGL